MSERLQPPLADPNVAFETAKARFLDGLAAFGEGRWQEAEAHYLASLASLPGRPSTLINLAATRLALGRPDAALASADQALAAEPDAPEAWLHRADALLRLANFDAALQAVDRLLAIDPRHPTGWLHRAHALERLGRPEAALAAFGEALAIDPASGPAWSGRGGLLRELGRPAEAAEAYRAALRHGADPVLHAYYLAAVEGATPPNAAPPGYVAALFDDYADTFDAHLVGQLGYRAPARLVAGIARPPGGRFVDVLDLGCGTGLCGPPLRPIAARLTGVDLAPRMLEKARALGVYDRLEAAEIVGFLVQAEGPRHDLIVAADVLIYFGDLAPLFAAVRRRLADGGVFAFTVEALTAGRGDFALRASLRYAHAEPYLRRLAGAHGLAVEAVRHAPVREDQRSDVAGVFVYLRAV